MTGPDDGITWDRPRAYEHGPCMAVGCNDPCVAAVVIIDGHRYRLCAADATDIPSFTPNLLEGSTP